VVNVVNCVCRGSGGGCEWEGREGREVVLGKVGVSLRVFRWRGFLLGYSGVGVFPLSRW